MKECHGESASKQQFLKTIGVPEEHINKTLEYPQDVASICKKLETAEIAMPATITKDEYDNNMSKKMIWEMSMKSSIKRLEKLESNMPIVWGQCSPMMQSKLKSLDAYSVESTQCACVWLLKEIQVLHTILKEREVCLFLWTTHGAATTGTIKGRIKHCMSI
jgi:hypothetical protein